MNKTLVLVLLSSVQLLVATEYYENPYNHVYEPKVGDYATDSTIKRVNGGLPVETTRKKEVLRIKDYHGTEIETQKVTATEFKINGFPETTIIYRDYVDDVLIRGSLEDSSDNAMGIVSSLIGRYPEKELLTIGEEWELTSVSLAEATLSNDLKVSGRDTDVTRFTFLGLETISTVWGPLQASKIKFTYTRSLQFQDLYAPHGKHWFDQWGVDTDSVTITITPISETSQGVLYYLKGFGRYKSLTSTTKNKWTMKTLNSRTQSMNEDAMPAESVTEETTFVSSNYNVTPTGFSVITPTQHSSTAYLDAWTWNGAFPWVYNANTDSWFYYRFNGNACYAYDVRSNKWFAFDEGHGGWRLAQ
jgi:hypothetical protein